MQEIHNPLLATVQYQHHEQTTSEALHHSCHDHEMPALGWQGNVQGKDAF